jgi:hypothetical protein
MVVLKFWTLSVRKKILIFSSLFKDWGFFEKNSINVFSPEDGNRKTNHQKVLLKSFPMNGRYRFRQSSTLKHFFVFQKTFMGFSRSVKHVYGLWLVKNPALISKRDWRRLFEVASVEMDRVQMTKRWVRVGVSCIPHPCACIVIEDNRFVLENHNFEFWCSALLTFAWDFDLQLKNWNYYYIEKLDFF